MTFSCSNYYTISVEKDIPNIADIKSVFENKSAVYLFKYDYNCEILYDDNDTVYSSLDKLIRKLYHEKAETIMGNYFHTSVELTAKGFSQKKQDLLKKTIEDDESFNYVNIKNLINIISENQHPLYIGKANKLRDRIKQHITGSSSDLKQKLTTYHIDINNCFISYHYMDDDLEVKTNELFEEIVTKVLKPGFVRRIG